MEELKRLIELVLASEPKHWSQFQDMTGVAYKCNNVTIYSNGTLFLHGQPIEAPAGHVKALYRKIATYKLTAYTDSEVRAWEKLEMTDER